MLTFARFLNLSDFYHFVTSFVPLRYSFELHVSNSMTSVRETRVGETERCSRKSEEFKVAGGESLNRNIGISRSNVPSPQNFSIMKIIYHCGGDKEPFANRFF